MTAVDFCERRLYARILHDAARRLRSAGSALRIWAALSAVVIAAIAIEASRLNAALDDASRMEQRREALAQRVATESKAASLVARKRKELLNMLATRRSAVLDAAAIVRIGNAVSRSVALTALRHLPDGFVLEGKTKNISDVSLTLRRLASSAQESSPAFELRSESGSAGVISFEIAVRGGSKGSLP